MDDFPGLFFEEGYRFADSKTLHSWPIQIQADFQNDSDWIGIGSSRPYLDYHVIVYLPEEGLTSIEGSYQWAIFDEDLNQLDSGEQQFRVPFSVRQFDTARYLRITADAASGTDPGTGEPIDVPAFIALESGSRAMLLATQSIPQRLIKIRGREDLAEASLMKRTSTIIR